MSTAADNRFYREKPVAPDDGGPAFPAPEAAVCNFGAGYEAAYMGMSIRDHFAAKAMAAIITSTNWTVAAADGQDAEPRHVAVEAYAIADAMIEARKQ